MRDSGKVAAPSVGIIVVNWNGADQSRRCLRSLEALDYPNYRVCLVDNGSSDGGAGVLAHEFPEVAMLSLAVNRGYAGGCNAGIAWAKQARMHYIWLLNNDTTVDEESLHALVTWAEDPQRFGQASILAPKILTSAARDRVWSAGGGSRWPWLKLEYFGLGEPDEAHETPRKLTWATGCALFFSLEVIDIVGPLDERYFLYLEDVDWCLRARRRGIPIWFVPTARLWHDVSPSVGSLDERILRYYATRNLYLLAFSHCGPVGRLVFALRLAITLIKIGLRVLLYPSYRRNDYYHAQTRALTDFLRGRFGQAPYPDGLIAEPALLAEEQGAS